MKKLLERFCRYVQMETTANDNTTDYPSSPGQWELGKILAEELKQIKLQDVKISEFNVITATIPGNVTGTPAIAWFAHLDTSPEYTAKNVKPIVHEKYDGKDIILPGQLSNADENPISPRLAGGPVPENAKIIKVTDAPQLKELTGKTIITSDGTTLLGADDKAGVAVVMTAADYLMSHPEIKHGPIKVCYTCDEEIGRGAEHVDLKLLDAAAGYTLDGEGHGFLEAETFSADLAVVTVQGINIHPGLATGRMVNAIRVASEFISRLPWRTLAPETTAGKQGFLHPYVLEGGVDKTTIKILLRSFETADLAMEADILKKIADTVMTEHPKAKITIEVKKQYRNMLEGLKKEPRAVALAEKAFKNLGLKYEMTSIRGGTDGSRLTEMGLPTPNLSTGMHNFHSPLEFACLEEMQQAVEVLVELAKCWEQEKMWGGHCPPL